MKLPANHVNIADGNRQKGFTIIEILIVVLIIAVFGTALYTFFGNISKKSTVERTVAITQQRARLALEMMARDIRMLGLNPTQNSNNGAGLWVDSGRTLSSNYFAFSADLNYDGDIDDPFERIAYYIEGGALIMETFILVNSLDTHHNAPVSKDTFEMLTGLTNDDLVFRYFDETNTEITPNAAAANDGARLYAVEISLTVRTPSVDGPIERSYSTMVRLRNKNF